MGCAVLIVVVFDTVKMLSQTDVQSWALKNCAWLGFHLMFCNTDFVACFENGKTATRIGEAVAEQRPTYIVSYSGVRVTSAQRTAQLLGHALKHLLIVSAR